MEVIVVKVLYTCRREREGDHTGIVQLAKCK